MQQIDQNQSTESIKSIETNEVLTYNLCIAGGSKVGKTSIVEEYMFNKFYTQYPTKKPTESVKHVKCSNGKNIQLHIFDMPAENTLSRMRPSYNEMDGAFFVINVDNKRDLSHEIIQSLQYDWNSSLNNNTNVKRPVILLVNATESRCVSSSKLVDTPKLDTEWYDDLCKKCNLCCWFAVSAKTGAGIKDAFDFMLLELCSISSISSISSILSISSISSISTTTSVPEFELKSELQPKLDSTIRTYVDKIINIIYNDGSEDTTIIQNLVKMHFDVLCCLETGELVEQNNSRSTKELRKLVLNILGNNEIKSDFIKLEKIRYCILKYGALICDTTTCTVDTNYESIIELVKQIREMSAQKLLQRLEKWYFTLYYKNVEFQPKCKSSIKLLNSVLDIVCDEKMRDPNKFDSIQNFMLLFLENCQ